MVSRKNEPGILKGSTNIIFGRVIVFLSSAILSPPSYCIKNAFRWKPSKAGIKKARSFLRGSKKITVKEALALERKQILKGRTGKGRKKLIKEMMGG